jgi:hypothetical protein
MAYFVRRCHDSCAVIQLHPDDREEIIASGLALSDAEYLCASKIEEMRAAAPPPPATSEQDPQSPIGRRSARQLAFKFGPGN